MTDDDKINALVAEHVLGWKHVPRSLSPYGDWLLPNGDHQKLPDACNDGNVILRVIGAMLALDRDQRVRMYASVGGWTVEIGESGEVVAPTLPRAVALAALKAKGVEIPDASE